MWEFKGCGGPPSGLYRDYFREAPVFGITTPLLSEVLLFVYLRLVTGLFPQVSAPRPFAGCRKTRRKCTTLEGLYSPFSR